MKGIKVRKNLWEGWIYGYIKFWVKKVIINLSKKFNYNNFLNIYFEVRKIIRMIQNGVDLKKVTTIIPIVYFVNGDKDYIEIGKKFKIPKWESWKFPNMPSWAVLSLGGTIRDVTPWFSWTHQTLKNHGKHLNEYFHNFLKYI